MTNQFAHDVGIVCKRIEEIASMPALRPLDSDALHCAATLLVENLVPIPVSERLPGKNEFVLAFQIFDCDGEPGGTWDCLWFHNRQFIEPVDPDSQPCDVTHWLPIPPRPE